MKCAICKKDLSGQKRYLFFQADSPSVWYVCKLCEINLNSVTDFRRKRWVHFAIEYLEEHIEKTDDVELSNMIRKLILERRNNTGMHIPYL